MTSSDREATRVIEVWTLYHKGKRQFGMGRSRKPKGASIVGKWSHPYIPEDGIVDTERWMYHEAGHDTQPSGEWLYWNMPR